jgi:hypothetical protein
MLYAAKCYWPGVSSPEFEREAAARLKQGRGDGPTYLGSLVFGDDALVLCLYEASSPEAVIEAATRARVPCERVMESVWLPAAGKALSSLGGLR